MEQQPVHRKVKIDKVKYGLAQLNSLAIASQAMHRAGAVTECKLLYNQFVSFSVNVYNIDI